MPPKRGLVQARHSSDLDIKQVNQSFTIGSIDLVPMYAGGGVLKWREICVQG